MCLFASQRGVRSVSTTTIDILYIDGALAVVAREIRRPSWSGDEGGEQHRLTVDTYGQEKKTTMPSWCSAYSCSNERAVENRNRGITFHK